MKKLLKLSIVALIFQIFIMTNVFANETDNFRVHFEEGLSVNDGESIEVPIILDNIDVNGVQKGIVALNFKFEYDNTVFELEKFDNDSYFMLDEELDTKLSGARFNEEVFKVVLQFDTQEYITERTVLGKIKIKAKEGVLSGNYELSITELEGGNEDSNIEVGSYITKLYVNGDNLIEEEVNQEYNDKLVGTTVKLESIEQKELKVSIEQNEDGSEIRIIPDNVNGAEVGKVLIQNDEVENKDGVFVAKIEQGKIYEVYFYGVDGNYLGMEIVKTSDNTVKEDEDNLPENDKDNVLEDDKDNIPEEDKDNTSEEKPNNQDKEDTNSVQTGDNIYIIINILMLMVMGLIIGFAIQKMRE